MGFDMKNLIWGWKKHFMVMIFDGGGRGGGGGLESFKVCFFVCVIIF